MEWNKVTEILPDNYRKVLIVINAEGYGYFRYSIAMYGHGKWFFDSEYEKLKHFEKIFLWTEIEEPDLDIFRHF